MEPLGPPLAGPTSAAEFASIEQKLLLLGNNRSRCLISVCRGVLCREGAAGTRKSKAHGASGASTGRPLSKAEFASIEQKLFLLGKGRTRDVKEQVHIVS